MKKIILILFAAIAIAAQAQNAQITSPDGGMNVYRKVKKQAYDTAQVNVYYKLKYLKDSTKTDEYTETQTIVQVSDRYARFGEYYQLLEDSLDIYLNKSRKNKQQGCRGSRKCSPNEYPSPSGEHYRPRHKANYGAV